MLIVIPIPPCETPRCAHPNPFCDSRVKQRAARTIALPPAPASAPAAFPSRTRRREMARILWSRRRIGFTRTGIPRADRFSSLSSMYVLSVSKIMRCLRKIPIELRQKIRQFGMSIDNRCCRIDAARPGSQQFAPPKRADTHPKHAPNRLATPSTHRKTS